MIDDEKKISDLIKSSLQNSVADNVGDDLAVQTALKSANHKTGASDLLILLIAGSFAFFIAIMAPFCVKKNIDQKK